MMTRVRNVGTFGAAGKTHLCKCASCPFANPIGCTHVVSVTGQSDTFVAGVNHVQLQDFPSVFKVGSRIKAEFVDWERVLQDINDYLPLSEQWKGPATAKVACKLLKNTSVPGTSLGRMSTYIICGRVDGVLRAFYIGTSDAAGTGLVHVQCVSIDASFQVFTRLSRICS